MKNLDLKTLGIIATIVVTLVGATFTLTKYLNEQQVETLEERIKLVESKNIDLSNKLSSKKEESTNVTIPFKHDGFDSLQTEYELNDTTWSGYFVEINEDGKPEKNEGFITFNQEGSRILGRGYSKGYEWLVEGVIYKGLLCYIYIGSDPNATSIGATTLQLDESGTVLSGQWSGWTPDGEKLDPQEIKLTRQK